MELLQLLGRDLITTLTKTIDNGFHAKNFINIFIQTLSTSLRQNNDYNSVKSQFKCQVTQCHWLHLIYYEM